MLRSRRTFCIATTAFVAAVSMSLIACGDDVSEGTPFSPESSETNPVEVDPVDVHPAETDSATTVPASTDSVEVDSAEVDQSMFETPCTAENEGKVDSIEYRFGMYGSSHNYYRCENGSWVKRKPWVRCDSKDAQEGDACIYSYVDGSLMYHQDLYVYTGNGVWEFYDKENRTGKFTVRTDNGRDTAFYKNFGLDGWKEIDEEQYKCFSKFDYHQDTCALETNEGKTYYQAASTHLTFSPIWMKIDYDPELGFCSFYDYQKYGEKDGKHYYCSQGMTALLSESDRFETKWTETELFPQQYSDSRKEGLTDEEFDVLDLPKEATEGDIVGGLLEVCFYNQQIVAIVDTPQVYKRFVLNFCIPQNYYRYENGSWTLDAHYRNENREWILQTEDEIAEEQKKNKCTQENEGTEIVTLPSVHIMQPTVSYTPHFTESSALAKPGVINQCISGRKVFKEFTYSRYEIVEEANLNN